MTEKRCPIMILLYYRGEANWAGSECLRDGCAWWNEDFECCGLIAQGVIWGLEAARKESHEG